MWIMNLICLWNYSELQKKKTFQSVNAETLGSEIALGGCSCISDAETYSRNTGGKTDDDDDDDWKSELDWKQAVLISIMIFRSHFIWVEIDWW